MEGLLCWDGHEYDACCPSSYDYYAHIRICDEATLSCEVGRIEKVRSKLGCVVMDMSRMTYNRKKAAENTCIDSISLGGFTLASASGYGGKGNVIFRSCFVGLAGRRFNRLVE